MSSGSGGRSAWTEVKERAADVWWSVPRWLRILAACFTVLMVARLVAEVLQG